MPAIDPNRMQAVFLLAADAPDATAREAILERECGGDAELQRRVVELLGAHDQSGSFLDHPVVKPVPLGDTLPPEPRGDSTGKTAKTRNDFGLSPGAVIAGRFRLLELIGEGGMGTVWRSEQREPVKRLVALKLVKPGMDSQQVLSRFEAERQALALMDHPSIAKVFDGGMTEHGRPYFVMEYVKGIPITTYCDEARLSLKDRLAIFTQVCEAVQHAHQKGIIHRDLKPSNILVCLYDGKPVPKVIDFGLAKAIHQPLTEHTLYTAHGLMVGTPLYMSPEQAEFNNLDIDTRSDVYSLGVVLYELLTGTTPLEKQQFKDAALQEVMRLIKEEEPQKPSTKLSGSGSLPSIAAQRSLEPAQLSRAVRGDLDWIVMKSLEKERSRRYETASGLARDIERYLHDEPVEACPPSAGYRFKKLVRRNKGPVAAALAVLLTLVIGVVGTTLGLIEARRQEGIALAAAGEERKAREAESQRAEAETQERKRAEEAEKLAKERLDEVSKEKDRADEYLAAAIAVKDFLCNDVLGQADIHQQADRKYTPDPNLTLRTALDRAAEKVDRALLGKSKGVEAVVRAAIGNAYYGLGEHNKAIEQLELAVEIYNKGLGPEGANTLIIMNNLSNLYFEVGRTAEGIALAEQVRDNGMKTFGVDHPQTYTSANNLAMKYEGVGRVDEAIPLLEKGLEGAIKALGEDHLQTLILRGNLARAYESAGRPAEAIALAEKSQQAFVKSLGPNNPHTLVATGDLARLYVGDERCAEAIALLEQARESCTKTLGPDHPDTLSAAHNLGRAYLQAGRTADSISLMQKVCDARKNKLGAPDPDTLSSLQGLALAYQQAGRTADAIKLLEQVRDAQSATLGPNDPRSLSTKGALAISYDEAGRTDEAIELQKHVLNGYNIMFGLAHPNTITAQVYLADMFEHAGKIGTTIPLLEQMCKYSEKKLGPDDPHTFIAQSKLALAYNKCGRTADALKIWDQSLPHASAKLPPLSPKLFTIRHGWIESLEQDNQSTKAAELRKALILDERKAFQHDDAKLGEALAQHGRDLLKAQKWAEADAMLRESLVQTEKREPEKWSTFHARSLLGEALLRQEKYADAEPLLRAGYEGLHERQASLPGSAKKFLPDSARRLVKLYQAIGKADLAQEWQQKLAAVKLPDVATDADSVEIAISAETTKELPENVLPAADAKTLRLLIGKEVEVEGTIVEAAWTSTGKSMQIQFAGDERNPFGLAAVMFEASRAKSDAAFGGDAAGSFVNAHIRLRGKLVLYGGFKPELKGAAQIILNDPAQVTILK